MRNLAYLQDTASSIFVQGFEGSVLRGFEKAIGKISKQEPQYCPDDVYKIDTSLTPK